MKSTLKKYLVIFICCLFIPLLCVEAIDVEDYTDSGIGDHNQAGNVDPNTSNAYWVSNQYGLRVTIYEINQGEKEKRPSESNRKGTVDFIGSINSSYYVSKEQLNRYDILWNNKSLSFAKPSSIANYRRVSASSWLENIYNTSTKTKEYVEDHLLGSCKGKSYDDYASDLDYITAMKTCLSNFFVEVMGSKGSTYIDNFFEAIRQNQNNKDIIIIYEPLAVVNIKNSSGSDVKYAVTPTELAYMRELGYNTNGVGSLITSWWQNDGTLKGVYVTSEAYQASKSLAGFQAYNLRTTALDISDHNNSSKGYGVGVGVTVLSETIKINLTFCTEKDGVYYNSDGVSVDEMTYRQDCLHACQEKDGIYYDMNGNAVSYAKYQQECSPQTCVYDLDKNIVTDCSEGTKGYVKDISDWACIYESKNSTNTQVKNHYYEGLENRYCSIYCREEVSYSYPGSSLTVRAGSHFSVGNTGGNNTLLPVNITGVSECRVTSGTGGGEIGKINHSLFTKDWTTANEAVKKAWDELNTALSKSTAIKNSTKTENVCASSCEYENCCITTEKTAIGEVCTKVNGENVCTTIYQTTCVEEEIPTKYYWYKLGYGAYNNVQWCSQTDKYTEYNNLYSNVDEKIQAYNEALELRNSYLKQLMQCNNFQRTYTDLDPSIQFKYNEGEYESLSYNYQYSGLLDSDVTITAYTNYYKGLPDSGQFITSKFWDTSNYEDATSDLIYDTLGSMSTTAVSSTNVIKGTIQTYKKYLKNDNSQYNVNKVYGSSSTIKGYSCLTTGKSCDTINVTYPTNDSLKMVTTKSYDYKLKDGLYNYVTKLEGQSLHMAPSKNYYVIGYSNLPIHYSRESRNDYNYYLDFSLEIFGTKQRFYDDMKLGNTTSITYGNDKNLDIYKTIWNNKTLNSMLYSNGSIYLNNGFVPALNNAGISIQDFLNTPCAKASNCSLRGSKIICNSDIPCTTCTSENTSCCKQNYSNLRACMQSSVEESMGSTIFTNTNYTYKCTYSVVNEVVCSPDDESCDYMGLSAIYRTIDLSDPFPDRDPSGNWNLELESKYILNNRDVNSEEIYTKRDPLYKITLTPDLISSIREYNKTHDMSDYDLNCNSEGRECKSDFIRKDYAAYFSGCGISGKGTNCVEGEAW